MKIFARIFAIMLMLAFCVSAHAADDDGKPAPPSARDTSLINLFNTMCLAEAPDFDRLDARASSMQLAIQEGIPTSGASRAKTWAGTLKTGPFGFSVAEMDGPTATGTSCAVSGDVDDEDAFRADLTGALGFKTKPVESTHKGVYGYTWRVGQYKTIDFDDTTPDDGSMVTIKLTAMQPR